MVITPYERQEAARNEMFAKIGSCIDAWNAIESMMVELFLELHDSNSHLHDALRHVYLSIHSFEVRLSMLNTSVQRCDTDSAFKASWNPLSNKLSKLASRRAEVAHSRLVLFQRKGWLVQPFYATATIGSTQARAPLSGKDLEQRILSFVDASHRVTRLWMYIKLARGRGEAFRAQVGDPAQLLENPNAQTPKETERPPQS